MSEKRGIDRVKAKAYLNQVQKLNKMIQNKIIEKEQWQRLCE